MKTKVISLILALMFVLSACGGAKPSKKPLTDHTIEVLQDSYVLNNKTENGTNVDYSDKSFYNSEILELKSTGAGYTRYTYLKFDVQHLKGSLFSSISLNITLTVKESPKTLSEITVYGCATNWEDKTLTFNKQPQQFNPIAVRSDVTKASNVTSVVYSFLVTDYIRQKLNNGENIVCFKLAETTTGSASQMIMHSSESEEDIGPNLFVSYSAIDNKTYTPSQFENLPNGLDTVISNGVFSKTSITAVEDSYVSGGDGDIVDATDINFGNSTILDIKTTGSTQPRYNRQILLKFDLSKVKTDYSKFKRIMLELNCTEGSAKQDIYVYACNPNSWKENVVTYNNKPEKEEKIATISYVAIGNVSTEITDYVLSALKAGKTVISFFLEAEAVNELAKFTSTESNDNAPKLCFYTSKNYYTTDLKYDSVNPWSYAMQLYNEWEKRWDVIKNSIGASEVETIQEDKEEFNHTVYSAYKPDQKYSPNATRIMSSLKNANFDGSETSSYDAYGGYTGGTKYTATGYYYTKFVDGRWWIIDPLGYPFFSLGLSTIDMGSTKQKTTLLRDYGSEDNWKNEISKWLFELGFNSGTGSAKALSNTDVVERPLSFTSGLSILSNYGNKLGINNSISGSTTFVGGVMPVFDPMLVEYTDNRVRKNTEGMAENPHILAWTSDNELHAESRMLDAYLNADPSLKVNAYSYAMAWTFMYKMTGKTDITFDDITDEHRKLFKAMVYDRYYKVVNDALDKYLPNQMFGGSRYLIKNFKDEYVMKVSGYWCDVITINYYGKWTPEPEALANMQRWSNTPIIVTEFYTKAMDACTEESGLKNESGAGWCVYTQKDRAMFYQNYALQLLQSKYCVGYNWFRYLDNDPTVLNAALSDIDSNKGIVDNDNKPYQDLIDAFIELNNNKYDLIKYFDNR